MTGTIHADNFEIYGTGSAGSTNMLRDGHYLSIGAQATPVTTNPPVGRTHHMRQTPVTGGAAEAVRCGYGSDKTTVTHGARFYFASLPSDNTSTYLWQLRDNANAAQLTLRVNSTGHLAIMLGGITGTQIAVSDEAVIQAGTWPFIEFSATIADAGSPGGSTMVKVNGETVAGLTQTGIDTKATAVAGVAQYVIARPQTTGGVTIDYTDVYVRDDGTFNGDTEWHWLQPDGDTTTTDFVRNTGGTDFEAIDDTTPDDDTTYVEGSTAGNASIYTLESVPAYASEVVAVITKSLARKTDPGSANFQNAIVSAQTSPNTTSNGTDRAITETYAYYKDVFETDPATGVAWTPAGVNAARLKFNKTL